MSYGKILLSAIITVGILFPTAAQNVGIGTNNPQSTLHVAGSVRVDGLASPTGLVVNNTLGDLISIPLSFNSTHVLKGDGSFGTLNGTVPASGLVASELYNNTTLLSAGYSLIGELPSVIRYFTNNTSFAANTWQPTYVRGIAGNLSAPIIINSSIAPLAVWTGTLMYVWTGNAVYSYNPDTDIWQWSILDNAASGGGNEDAIVWTGSEIILWKGGVSAAGYKFNPLTNILTPMSVTNAPSSRYKYSMVWDGTRVIVWGGVALPGGTGLNTGAFYNPATDTWTTMNTAGAPTGKALHTAVWNTATNRMIVWGGSTSLASGELNTGGTYDPATNAWTGATSTTNAPSARNKHTAAWTNTEMIVIGGSAGGAALNTGGKYNPSTNTWFATSTTGSPTVSLAALTWIGTQLYVSGGLNGTSGSSNLLRYDPSLNTWTSVTNFSKGKYEHRCFYKSNMLLVWGGWENNGVPQSNEGFRYFLSNSPSSATTLNPRTLYLYQKL